jgi:hypothetical protein
MAPRPSTSRCEEPTQLLADEFVLDQEAVVTEW